MEHKLIQLPFDNNALAPNVSAETIDYHYGKHHKAYVDKLNKLIIGTEFENSRLEDIVNKSSGGIFNNAAQIWNHDFYWKCLKPKEESKLSQDLIGTFSKHFGSFDQFKDLFTNTAVSLFGSGWAWLVKEPDGTLTVEATSNASNPLKDSKKALLTCDLWEHAYYIDYRNARAKYLEAFWNIVNWDFVSQGLKD